MATSFLVIRAIWNWSWLRRIIINISKVCSKRVKCIIQHTFIMYSKCFWKTWCCAVWQMINSYVVHTISSYTLILHWVWITWVLMCCIVHKPCVLFYPSLWLINSFKWNRITFLKLPIDCCCSWQPCGRFNWCWWCAFQSLIFIDLTQNIFIISLRWFAVKCFIAFFGVKFLSSQFTLDSLLPA